MPDLPTYMDSGGSDDARFTYPKGPTYRPPIALLGGLLWSLAIASFVTLWFVGDFQSLAAASVESTTVALQVVVVLVVFATTAPLVFALRRHARAA